MKKEFVPYEQSLQLKELGFDEPCFGRYYYKESYPMLNPNSGETELVFEFGQYIKQTEITILAPLYQQAFTWFREKHQLSSWVYNSDNSKFYYTILQNGRLVRANDYTSNHEEAELFCLIKLIEIVKNK